MRMFHGGFTFQVFNYNILRLFPAGKGKAYWENTGLTGARVDDGSVVRNGTSFLKK